MIIPVDFDALAMSMVVGVVYGCFATIIYISSSVISLEEYFVLVGKLKTKFDNLTPFIFVSTLEVP